MNKNVKEIFKYIIIFLVTVLAINVFLYISSLIPRDRLKYNVLKTVNVLYEETNIKKVDLLTKSVYLDNYTDSLMVNICYSIDNKTPYKSYMLARKNYIPGITKSVAEEKSGEVQIDTSKDEYYSDTKLKEEKGIGELREVIEENPIQSFEYARYWHGWIIFIRPLLTIMDINGIRILLTAIILGLSLCMLILICRKINFKVALVIFLGLLNIDYYLVGFSMQESFVFIIMFITCIIILTSSKTLDSPYILFFIVGMYTNIFDFLTVPIITLLLPMIIYILLKQEKEELVLRKIIISIIKISLIWGIGYILIWISKWVLTDLFLNKKTLNIAIQQVLYRSMGEKKVFFRTLFLNCNATISIWLILIIVFLITEIVKIGKNILKYKIDFKKSIPFFVIMLIPIVWYGLTNSHSNSHWYFTYRNFLVFYVSLCLAMTNIQIVKV